MEQVFLQLESGARYIRNPKFLPESNKTSMRIEPILTSPMPSDIWSFLRNPGEQSEDLKKFLKEEIKVHGTFLISSFENQVGLKHLSHQTTTTQKNRNNFLIDSNVNHSTNSIHLSITSSKTYSMY